MTRQTQFLDVINRDEAQKKFESALDMCPLGLENVPLSECLGRILAVDVLADTNVPCFDRSNFDGYAVNSTDTIGASENAPVFLSLRGESIAAGDGCEFQLAYNEAASVSTGGMIPRGANAVCLIEHTDIQELGDLKQLVIKKSVFPGSGISFAGTDISHGETVLRAGQKLTSRETGVLAAIGKTEARVFRRPQVAVISTGNEIIAPGKEMQPGLVFDSNARIISDAVRELGGEAIEMGIAIDDLAELNLIVDRATDIADIILLSGGTSKGDGDLSYQVVSKFDDPGIIAHGVALKPGKPICLAVTKQKPVVVLPGFPTSAIFTFHEFVAPVIRKFAGAGAEENKIARATLATKANSEIGRTEYLLVGLTKQTKLSSEPNFRAFPMGKGSGSVTTFSQADGFITIDRHTEIVEANSVVDVQLIGRDIRPADLVVIGSHCVVLDQILSKVQRAGFQVKFIAVGSVGGLRAVQNGDCDVAGIHLLDSESGEYNSPFLSDDLLLVPGYKRIQGFVFRKTDSRFENKSALEAIATALNDPNCLMINRNKGSGTRILIDQLILRTDGSGNKPVGYEKQTSNHHAVCAAIAQNRADWGIAIDAAVNDSSLNFLPIQDECYDFVVQKNREANPALDLFKSLISQ